MAEVEIVKCPMLGKEIDVCYCIELQMIAGGEIKPTSNERILTEKEFQVCLGCKKQENPIPDGLQRAEV